MIGQWTSFENAPKKSLDFTSQNGILTNKYGGWTQHRIYIYISNSGLFKSWGLDWGYLPGCKWFSSYKVGHHQHRALGYPQKIWPYMVQYLQFRILRFPLKSPWNSRKLPSVDASLVPSVVLPIYFASPPARPSPSWIIGVFISSYSDHHWVNLKGLLGLLT